MYRKPHPIHEANAFSQNKMSRHGQDMPANRLEKCPRALGALISRRPLSDPK